MSYSIFKTYHFRAAYVISLCTTIFGAFAMQANAQSNKDLNVTLDGCALNINRLTLNINVKNNSAFGIYLAQVNNGSEVNGSSSEGSTLYIGVISGMAKCQADVRACQNNSIINDVNQLTYIEPHEALSSSVTFSDGNRPKIDPSDTATLPIVFMARKATTVGGEVGGTALPPPGRPYTIRSGFSRIPVGQCR